MQGFIELTPVTGEGPLRVRIEAIEADMPCTYGPQMTTGTCLWISGQQFRVTETQVEIDVEIQRVQNLRAGRP